MHPFEKAKLGKAPFRFVGAERKVGPYRYTTKCGLEVQVGAPGQPMGTCDYCGQGIAVCCQIVSSDGKRFEVGTSCVERTGDLVLAKKAKSEARRQAAKRRDEKITAELDELIATKAQALAAIPSPNERRAEKGETLLDGARWYRANAGANGRATARGRIKRELGEK